MNSFAVQPLAMRIDDGSENAPEPRPGTREEDQEWMTS